MALLLLTCQDNKSRAILKIEEDTMPKGRPDIKAKDVVEKLKGGMTCSEAAMYFNCSSHLIYKRSIEIGYRRKGNRRTIAQIKKDQERLSKNYRLCSCCQIAKVPSKPLIDGTKLTRLCERCYKTAHQKPVF